MKLVYILHTGAAEHRALGMNHQVKLLIFLGFLMGILHGTGHASEIYRWTDEDGVVHFSDTRPTRIEDVTVLRVNVQNPPGYDPTEDPYSIRNQAQRTNALWTGLEKLREERRDKRREEEQRHPQPVRYYDPYTNYYAYRYYPPYQPSRPPLRPSRPIIRQVSAMNELGLTGQRPYSINSGAHHARVASSNNFLNAAPSPPPQPRAK
jgi:hypothetical protein